MASAEAIVTIQALADEDIQKSVTTEGFLAAAKDQHLGVFFARDAEIDSIFTYETYSLHPDRPDLLVPVKCSLITMAQTQGKVIHTLRDEKPGQIIHELRHKNDSEPKNQERLRELEKANWPVDEHGLRVYYSIDATPLFVFVGAKYILITQDQAFFKWLDPSIRAAISWMENFGDVDGDSFIEFRAKNRNTLLNQGWKDSSDSIEVAPNKRPEEPIALVEVQGYAYMAYLTAAELYRSTGEIEYAKSLYQKAGVLKRKLNDEFWMEDEGFFAYALDGNKDQVREVTSNVGHLLMSGIIDDDKVSRVVNRLMQPDMLTPWGVRTLSSLSPNFSDKEPSAYHNGGGLWPHDNAIIYLGLKKTGFYKEAGIVRDASLDAQYVLNKQYGSSDDEVFLVDRFGRIRPYADACRPQSWAATANRMWADPLEVKQLLALT